MLGGCLEMNLSEIQQEIVDTPGNMIVSASAGTGKTHTMVAKIAKEIEKNHSHKVIAAITFTIKAAKEIRDRLTIDSTEHFIGTNNSFAIEEIIKPFARDVYGADYHIEMCTDYSIKKRTFQECLDYLKSTRTICAYADNKKNFVFELALDIARKSGACQLFLQAKYFKIYVDEYQDCDKTMHEFFMYLCNTLKIDLFVVGDDKQSIYIWRGAYPEAFRSILQMSNFSKKVLRDNFRSCLMIQNYSNLLNDDTRLLYKADCDISPIVFVNSSSSSWIVDVQPYLDLSKDVALLRFSNDNAKSGASELSRTGVEFTYVPKTPLSYITTDVVWLYNAIAQYFVLPKYSIYDFMDEIPEESIGDRKIKRYLEDNVRGIKDALDEHNDTKVLALVTGIAAYFGYEVNEEHVRAMINTIVNDEYHPAFHMDELSHVAITFHSSKGLEFEQVIVFANDYALNKPDSIYNHYVAVTRAKSKLIIVRLSDIHVWAGGQFCQNLKILFGKSGVTPSEVMTIA